jgi:hypothetical protein
MLGGLAIKGKNYSLEIKDPWKRSWHLKTLPNLQYYEARVDIFLQVPILRDKVKFNL